MYGLPSFLIFNLRERVETDKEWEARILSYRQDSPYITGRKVCERATKSEAV